LIQEQLTDAGHELVSYTLIPDEAEEIRSHLTRLASEQVEVVVINGGTGISNRDNTFDAVQNMIETSIPGFGELFRMLSYQDIGPAAMLSRATAGLIGNMVVFSLPGSRGAVDLAMQELILPQIGHLVSEIRK
jgi:molybdenum cofactor biosynthesis protein B